MATGLAAPSEPRWTIDCYLFACLKEHLILLLVSFVAFRLWLATIVYTCRKIIKIIHLYF